MNKLLLGIDPGKTTGFAALHLGEGDFSLEEVDQFTDPDNVWKDLDERIHHYEAKFGPENVLVLCETFEHRPDVINPDETPKYIIKDLDRYVIPGREDRFIYRMASQAKTGVPPAQGGKPDRLKAFGLYQTGFRHANDALRHIVSYALNKLHYPPLIVAGWGEPGRN